jgi:phospholipid-binding lipoprotein MlaA
MNHHHQPHRHPKAAIAAGALLLALLQGCATGPGRNPTDPLEPWNRGVSQFNENVDAVILKPTATFYREKVPALARTGVSNFFGNLGDAWSAVNSALQLKMGNAAENWMRFTVNTFFGLGGILDIASDANIERHKEDFGQTLGRYGVPAGPYLVLPLLGSSTLRDTVALPIDWKGDIAGQINPESQSAALVGLRVVDQRSNLLRAGDVLEGAALDKYSFTRDAYLQRRRAQIFEGARPKENPNDGSDGQATEGQSSDGQVPALPAAPAEPRR